MGNRINVSEVSRVRFTDNDVINLDDWQAAGSANVKTFLFHDHGFVVAVAFADNEQDALDIVADSGKLEFLEVDDELMATDYPTSADQERLIALGNDCKLYDTEGLSIVQLPNVPLSFCACFNAAIGDK